MKIYFEAPETWAVYQVVGMLLSAALVFGLAKLSKPKIKETSHE